MFGEFFELSTLLVRVHVDMLLSYVLNPMYRNYWYVRHCKHHTQDIVTYSRTVS